jgi:hypothetical protein
MRTFLKLVTFSAATCGASLLWTGCSSTSCDDTNTCGGTATDGSADGLATQDGNGGGDVVTGSDGDIDGGATDGGGTGDAIVDAPFDNWDGFDGFTCLGTWTPKDNACVLDDSFGIFVATTASGGSDTTGTGAKAKPFATLGHALATLGAKKRIYVCNGDYAEQVTVATGVEIYGGLTCASLQWAVAPGTSGRVASPSAEFALKVNNVSAAVRIEDMEFGAANASGAGTSSTAAIVVTSPAVTLRRVVLKAGNAGDGTAGATQSNFASGQAENGLPASGATQGGSKTCTCTNSETTVGSRGGPADVTSPGTGADGLPALSENPTGLTPKHDGKGGAAACLNGDPGANPQQSAAGGGGSTNGGTLTSTGWSNANGGGASGGFGKVAQGGGGGGGGIGVATGGGGGGGCGGCGGGGGTGGTAGGSSIALASVGSAVTLDGCTLTAKNAGVGGKGGDAQAGQSGGFGGGSSAPGCNGGAGGLGGAGGGGGGGAGGNSFAIAYTVTAPTETTTTKTSGNAGAGGAPGTGGGATAGKAGTTGTAGF